MVMPTRRIALALAALIFTALAAGAAAGPPTAAAACPPAEWTRPRLEMLATEGFAVASEAERQALAVALLPCLADPDPRLRDGIAFEALSGWMRSDALSVATRRAILQRLVPLLAPPAGDAGTATADAGFQRPFAALVLSEVARTDRLAAWLTQEERLGLLSAAAAYLPSVRDYRGFDETEGWRHGVAHGADLLLQLALNQALERPELDRILAAVASQVAPAGAAAGGPFYVYGEPARLARPVLAVASRGLHSPAEWTAWLARITDPGPLGDWRAAFTTQAGLARRHDTRAFLEAMYVGARESGEADLEARLLPGLRMAVASVP